jgi:predicted transcriptional regulator of viral defense system
MDNLIKIFERNSGFLKSKELTSRNQWRILNKMLADGIVVKIKRGVYALSEYQHSSSLVEVSHLIPCGVVCTFSAWFYYGLTTTIPHSVNLAVNANKKVSLPDYPPVKLHYLTEKYYQLGITEIIIDQQKIKIYDIEKSVCDAVKFRNKAGMDIAIEVVRNYVRRRQERNLDKLTKYARQMRIENIMQSFVMPML